MENRRPDLHLPLLHNRHVHHGANNEGIDFDHHGKLAGPHRPAGGQTEPTEHKRRQNGTQSLHLAAHRRQRCSCRAPGGDRQLQHRASAAEGAHLAEGTTQHNQGHDSVRTLSAADHVGV